MNIQILANDSSMVKPLKDLLINKGGFIHRATERVEFFYNSTRNPSNLYIIQSDYDILTIVLDIIKDLRIYFGAYPLIFVLSKDKKILDSTAFLNAGADNIFSFPLDLNVIEDFIGSNLQRDSFLPIKYRNIPSGGSPTNVNRSIKLSEIRSNGIIFKSNDFYSRGSKLQFSIGEFLDIDFSQIECKIISTEKDDEEDYFNYFAEYHHASSEALNKIRFVLKQKT